MPAAAPLVAPTPNVGNQAQGHLFVAQALDAMRKAIAVLDPTSPLGQAVLAATKNLGKQVGSAPPEAQVSNLYGQLQDARRTAMQRLALMNMANKAGGAGSAPVSPPVATGGAPAAAAPPATPMAA